MINYLSFSLLNEYATLALKLCWRTWLKSGSVELLLRGKSYPTINWKCPNSIPVPIPKL